MRELQLRRKRFNKECSQKKHLTLQLLKQTKFEDNSNETNNELREELSEESSDDSADSADESFEESFDDIQFI